MDTSTGPTAARADSPAQSPFDKTTDIAVAHVAELTAPDRLPEVQTGPANVTDTPFEGADTDFFPIARKLSKKEKRQVKKASEPIEPEADNLETQTASEAQIHTEEMSTRPADSEALGSSIMEAESGTADQRTEPG